MLEYIKGVSEAVLAGDFADLKVTFRVVDGTIQSIVTMHATDLTEINTMPLRKATTFDRGRAVGENLVSAIARRL